MFFISMPKTFKVGDTANCRINQEPARLTWRDAKTLVIEPNDARAIITTDYEGDLIHFTCGDAGNAGGRAVAKDGGYIVSQTDRNANRYWIAINGSSCAISGTPMRDPMVIPTPEQMFGFPTAEEARKAQQICLTAPIQKANAFLQSLLPDIKSGRILYRRPDNPGPQTRGETMWLDGPIDGGGSEPLPGLPGGPPAQALRNGEIRSLITIDLEEDDNA
jgi:hypothetical protein